jgi:O-Antigen ligase
MPRGAEASVTVMSVVFGVLGIIALTFSVMSLNASRRAKDLTFTFWLLFAVVIVANITALISQFTGGRTIVTTVGDSYVAVLSPAAQQVSSFTLPAMAMLSGLYVLTRLRRGMTINSVAIVFALLLLIGAIAGAMHGFPLISRVRLTLIMPALALIVAPPGRDGLRGAASAISLLVGLSALLALIAPDQAADKCDPRKCGLFGQLFNGVAFNFNGFGLLVALSIPILYFGLRRFGMFFVLLAVTLVLASGSRTAQLASLVTVVLVLFYERARRTRRPANPVLPVLVCAISFAAAAALPFAGLDQNEFTGRVGLWDLALSRLSDTWLVGNGPDAWASLTGTGVISVVSAYSTHNQVVEVLFISGAIGLVVFTLMGCLVVARNKTRLAELAIIMAPILIASSTERPWTLGIADWVSWSVLLMLTVQFPARENDEPNLMVTLTPAREAGSNSRLRHSRLLAPTSHEARSMNTLRK